MDRIDRLVDLQAAALAKVAIEIDTMAKAEMEQVKSGPYMDVPKHFAKAQAFIEAKQVITNAIIEVTREAAK
jgi:hypothetical protein